MVELVSSDDEDERQPLSKRPRALPPARPVLAHGGAVGDDGDAGPRRLDGPRMEPVELVGAGAGAGAVRAS